MRALVTSLLACIASGLAGGIVAQLLAVWTNAGEEFIAVFFLNALIVFLATVSLFVAQFFGLRAVSRTALGLILLFLVFLVVLMVFSVWQAGPSGSFRADAVLIGSIALSGFLILFVHWLVVRWRMG